MIKYKVTVSFEIEDDTEEISKRLIEKGPDEMRVIEKELGAGYVVDPEGFFKNVTCKMERM